MADNEDDQWRDPGGATLWAIVILAVNIAVHLAFLGLDVAVGRAADYSSDPAALTTSPWKLAHWALDLVQFLMLFGAIGLVAWILRISRNAHTLTTRTLEKPWWAALWWYVIPIMSLFKGYGAMIEIWDVSASSPAAGRSARAMLYTWWTASILANGLGGVSSRFPGEPVIDAIYRVLAVIVCAALIVIARRIRDMQREKHVAYAFSDPGAERPLSVLERING